MAGPLKKPFVASSPAARIVDDATDNRDRSDLWKGGFDVWKSKEGSTREQYRWLLSIHGTCLGSTPLFPSLTRRSAFRFFRLFYSFLHAQSEDREAWSVPIEALFNEQRTRLRIDDIVSVPNDFLRGSHFSLLLFSHGPRCVHSILHFPLVLLLPRIRQRSACIKAT